MFHRLRTIARQRTGISVGEEKAAFVVARLEARAQALRMDGARAYLDHLGREPGEEELAWFVDLLCANFTAFFREASHFETTHAWVRDRLAAGQRRFRFWSAGCSSGEEVWTLAMVVSDPLDAAGADWRILGSDLSAQVLRRAASATYDVARVDPVPAALRARHLRPVGGDRPAVEITEALRRHAVFRRLNLAHPPWPLRGALDAVFCRNVMIYLDDVVRRRLVGALERVLVPGGLLFIGHAESLLAESSSLELVRPSVYRKRPKP